MHQTILAHAAATILSGFLPIILAFPAGRFPDAQKVEALPLL
jgi:hypothetical protein